MKLGWFPAQDIGRLIIPSHQAAGKALDEIELVIDQKKADGRHGIFFARAIDPLKVTGKLGSFRTAALHVHIPATLKPADALLVKGYPTALSGRLKGFPKFRKKVLTVLSGLIISAFRRKQK